MTEWDKFVEKEIKRLCRIRKKETGIRWNLDHMLPRNGVTVSGLNVGDNMQCIPEKMNSFKANSMQLTEPGEWLHATVVKVEQNNNNQK